MGSLVIRLTVFKKTCAEGLHKHFQYSWTKCGLAGTGINELSCAQVSFAFKVRCLPFLGVAIWLLIGRQLDDELAGLGVIEVVGSLG